MNATQLEAEIKELEASLEKTTRNLALAETHYTTAYEVATLTEQVKTLSKTILNQDKQAVSSERKYRILKGLGKICPESIPALNHTNSLQFNILGPSPSSCLVVTFVLTDQSTVKCQALLKPELFSKNGNILPKSLSIFFKSRVSALCDIISSKRLGSHTEIGTFLRQIEWEFCRLISVGSELSLILKRYKNKARIIKLEDNGKLLLNIQFSGRRDAALNASFELNAGYPLDPAPVTFNVVKGKIDVALIRKQTLKNPKTGYGYLSRTCDMLKQSLLKS